MGLIPRLGHFCVGFECSGSVCVGSLLVPHLPHTASKQEAAAQGWVGGWMVGWIDG